MSKKKEFKETYPALSKELKKGRAQEFKIGGARIMSENTESAPENQTYTPDVIDYIRRCDTITQAIEIVEYLLKRGEINKAQAKDIKTQLKSSGLRSFGSKKEKDYYLHHGLE